MSSSSGFSFVDLPTHQNPVVVQLPKPNEEETDEEETEEEEEEETEEEEEEETKQ